MRVLAQLNKAPLGARERLLQRDDDGVSSGP
jgi:hypothetical protein